MEGAPCDERLARSAAHRISVRWAGLFTLLLTEVLFLTVRFDTKTLKGGWPWLEQLADSMRVGFDMLAAGLAIALLALGRGLPDELRNLRERLPDHCWGLYLWSHLAGFAGFAVMTGLILEGGLRTWTATAVMATCWAGLGLLVLLTWVWCIIPLRTSVLLLSRYPGVIMASMAVGLAELLAGHLTSLLWQPLARNTFWLVRNLLEPLGEEVVSLPADRIIGTTTFCVEIAQPCSGYEGIGMTVVLIGAFLLISRQALRFPRALWLLPVGCLLSYVANAVRIVTLILLGTHVSEDLAAGAFHSRAGALFFLAVGFGLIVLAIRSPLFAADVRRPRAAIGWTASEAYLCPFIALVGLTLVTGAFSVGPDPLYPLALIVSCSLLWWNRRYYDDLRWTFSPRAIALGVVVFAIWIAFKPGKSGAGAGMAPVGFVGAGMTAWFIVRALGTVIVAPLVEELAFRGYLTRRLVTGDFQSVQVGTFAWPSFLVSSALFGILQERWIAGTLAGMLYALALYDRRELSDAVLAHSITNALIVGYALASGDWSLWI